MNMCNATMLCTIYFPEISPARHGISCAVIVEAALGGRPIAAVPVKQCQARKIKNAPGYM